MRKIVVLAHDEDLSDRVARAMDRTATCVHVDPTAGNAPAMVRHLDPDMLVVEAGSLYPGAGTGLFERIAALREMFPDKPIVGIGDELAAQTVLLVMRAGANDFVERDSSIDELRAQLSTHFKARSQPRAANTDSRLTVVMAGRPDENETHLAVNVAVQLARQTTTRDDVLLVDLCLPSSEAAIGLDLKPTYTFHAALDDVLRLDKTLVSTALARHEPSGLLLLPLATGAEDVSDVSPADILSILFMLRAMFAEVVVNVGHLRHSGLIGQLLGAASSVLVVTTQHFAAIKSLSDLIQTRDLAGIIDHRVHLVVAEYDEKIDITAAKIGEVLGITAVHTLPPARTELINGFNSGRPLSLVRPEAPYVRAVRSLLQSARGKDGPVAAGRGRMSRVLSWIGLL